MITNLNSTKRYMKLGNFWKDPHNKLMYNLSNDLIAQRDVLTNFAKQYSKDYFQSNNGVIHPIKRKGLFSLFQGPSAFVKKMIEETNLSYIDIIKNMTAQANKLRKK